MTANKKKKRSVRKLAGLTGHSYEGAHRAMQSGQGRAGRFEAIVRKTIELAKTYAEEPSEPGSLSSADKIRKYLENPARRALVEYLLALGNEDVCKLQTIMYAGRDADNIRVIHRELRPPQDNAVVTILGKTNRLAEYLANGVREARKQGFDIESSFADLL